MSEQNQATNPEQVENLDKTTEIQEDPETEPSVQEQNDLVATKSNTTQAEEDFSDSDIAYEDSEEISTNYTNESEDSDEDFESRLAAFADYERLERNKYTLIRPEDFGWDHITIQDRYQYFIDIGVVNKPTQYVHHYFKQAILSDIRDKQWFAYWEAHIPINGKVEIHPCIVKVNHLESDLMANCTYHRSYDVYESYIYSGDEQALLRENEIKYFLEKNCIPFMHLSCPVFYISDNYIDDEVTTRHLEDLEHISLLLDYCRFWDTVVYREWDEEMENEEVFRADLEKRLKLYQCLHDGTMNSEQKLKYYQIVNGYEEWRGYLDELYSYETDVYGDESIEYERDLEIANANLAVYKCRKMQDFLESVDQDIPYTNVKPLILQKKRYSDKDVIHLVNGMPTFNANEVKYATVQTDPEITEVLHHETVFSALETCYQNDVVSLMAGDYDVQDAIFDQNCVVRGLPWRIETDPTSQKPKVPEDGEIENVQDEADGQAIYSESHSTRVYRKLIAIDSDIDIVLHGGFAVNSDTIIFDQLHFRCEGLDKISVNGKNVRFNRCTFHLEAGFLEINGQCTFTDCVIVAENQTPLVQKIGGNVSLIGCHWLGSLEVESHPVYQPEMDDFRVGDVIYRDVCRNTEQNVQYFEPITDDEEEEEENEDGQEEDKHIKIEAEVEAEETVQKLTEPVVIDEKAGGEQVQVSTKLKQLETADSQNVGGTVNC